MTDRYMTQDARFWLHVHVEGDHYVWQSATHGFGYGTFDGESAHRYVYRTTYGAIPDGMIVRHTCDIPACVRPTHLILGTLSDNTQDMLERGRNNPKRKLNADQVLAIVADNRHYKLIAEQYGIGKQMVSRIKLGLAWKSVTMIDNHRD